MCSRNCHRLGETAVSQGRPCASLHKETSKGKSHKGLEQMMILYVHGRYPRLVFLFCALLGISGLEMFGCSTENEKHLQEDWQRPVHHTTRTHHAPTH